MTRHARNRPHPHDAAYLDARTAGPLDEAAGLGRAAEACAKAGNIGKAIKIALDIGPSNNWLSIGAQY